MTYIQMVPNAELNGSPGLTRCADVTLTKGWSEIHDSNVRPLGPEPSALPG